MRYATGKSLAARLVVAVDQRIRETRRDPLDNGPLVAAEKGAGKIIPQSLVGDGDDRILDDLVLQCGRFQPSPFSTSRAAKTGVERDTYPTATNSRGEITGIYTDANSNPHGFVRTADGTITTFDMSTDVGTIPHSINESGTITGAYFGSNSGPNLCFMVLRAQPTAQSQRLTFQGRLNMSSATAPFL